MATPETPEYDNDEVMADLGRTFLDMIIGQRRKDHSPEQIGRSLIHLASEYITEPAETEEEDA